MLKLSTWMIVALAATVLIAGCRSSGGSTTTVNSQTAVPPGNAQQAVASCEQAVRSLHTISASAKAKLEAICKKAGSGGQAGLQNVAHEVCIELLNASHVPAGAAKEKALAACKAISVK
jgi:hypothetical protein